MITDHTKIIIANNLIQVKPKLPSSKGGRLILNQRVLNQNPGRLERI